MNTRVSGMMHEAGYSIIENAPLEGRNTFRVAARADLYIDVRQTRALPELFRLPALKYRKVLVLGEGSNILFTRDWPDVVLSISARRKQVTQDHGDRASIRVEAGENWNDFVLWTLGHGFVGLENLALIPGTVGAAPIQNIGAYGVEVREFVEAVDVFDRETGSLVQLSSAQCQFGYRDSRFKREPARYVITSVEFTLPRVRALRLDYSGVREELAAMQIQQPTALLVAEAISRLRTRKLPNPALLGNAGSFFKNPVVDNETADTLRSKHAALVTWPANDGFTKLSAAWLIESCGLKGLRDGDAGVSDQHALVLVNHGHASGAQLWGLAERIRGEVEKHFGLRLETEPVIV